MVKGTSEHINRNAIPLQLTVKPEVNTGFYGCVDHERDRLVRRWSFANTIAFLHLQIDDTFAALFKWLGPVVQRIE